ncbi:hypothetical protein [Eudoraea adriatica]|uniref:hypothetical protein n=1 Tax=Eudoraea adriatica TaxID=446681 RepID=UPI0003A32E20|nr:hypothetical protein [Eudoraea adriatica]
MNSLQTAFYVSIISLFLLPRIVMAQDSLLVRLAIDNQKEFNLENNKFHGEGWEYIKRKTINSKNILVGEDHFSNEIPVFVKALTDITSFDNFYIEVDPYSTRILEKSLKEYSDSERQKFNAVYGELFSFYSMEPEYKLLEHIANNGINLLGSDQIVMYADRLIVQDLMTRSKNPSAKEIYSKIIEKSLIEFERFHEVTKNPLTMYFMTSEFLDDINKLEALVLSEEEDMIIADMKESVTIYKEQNHRKRVRLILNQLMKDYPEWKNSKNLFKYGANHMARGESFLTTFDIGNMVANITESNYQESFHIMIIGESGALGSPFKSFPPNPIDIENGFYLSYLKPFFNITKGTNWKMFNLIPLRKMVERRKLQLDNINLLRVIKGFDILVIVPEVTPAKLLTTPNNK